jgi:hypothetical protein
MERVINHETQEAVRPITPTEAAEVHKDNIPPEVLAIVNRILAEDVKSSRIIIKQKDIVQELVNGGLDREEIFAKHWLDFEDIYRDAGWTVGYDKPAYNEDYEPYFEFTVPRKCQLGSVAMRQCTCNQ